MEWIIPGTVLAGQKEDAGQIEQQFSAMFLGGGMVLSQVSAVTGVEPHDVQNWVKRGFLPPPEKKRYSMGQLCRIITIHMLKPILPMEQICGLLSYVNGDLDSESDDMIDDAKLYFMFVRLAANAAIMQTPQGRDAQIAAQLQDYQEPVPGAKARVEQVLKIMLTAWAAAQLRKATEQMLQQIHLTMQ